MLIAQILSGKGAQVVTTRPEASVADVARLLKEKHIGAVVVADGRGTIKGIISERDLARGLADHGAALMEMEVAQLMTREVTTCTPGDGLEQLMHQMTEGRFRHLPVVDKGKMVGIISIGDVVKHRLQELETERQQLHEYIAGGV
jgi:CBS domain-containing protein